MVRQRSAGLLLVAAALSACGGAVDLGGKSRPDAVGGGDSDGDGGAAMVDSSVKSERVAPVDDVSFGTLAVSDTDLILGGIEANGEGGLLYRCDKNRCEPTLERLTGTSGWFSIQMSDGRLGAARGSGTVEDIHSFGTYALPSMTDEQEAIGDLPQPGAPLFYDGFVYWTLGNDKSTYRCALPSCPDGPQRLGRGYGDLVRVGEYLFWKASATAVYRAPLAKPDATEALLLDEQLSLAPSEIKDDHSTGTQLLAGSDRYLYAAFAEETEADDYPSSSVIMRWPAGGGAREIVVDAGADVDSLFVFGDELVWVASDADGSHLSSCDASTCEATTRSLGTVMYWSRAVAADATHLYWLAAKRDAVLIDGTVSLREHEVRRVARVPSRD